MNKVFEKISLVAKGPHGEAVLYAGALGLILSDVIPTPADAAYFWREKQLRDKWKAGSITPAQYWEKTLFAYYMYNPIWWSLVFLAMVGIPGNIQKKAKVGLALVGTGAVMAVIYKNYRSDIRQAGGLPPKPDGA
jgi:hypothetical protein